MSRRVGYFLGLFALATVVSNAFGQDRSKPTDKSSGYWEFVESFIDVYPPVDKRNKAGLFELKWEPRQITARVGNLVGAGGNIQKEPVSERTDVWTWTTPPRILIPGEKHSVKLAYKVVAVRGDAPQTSFSAAFVKSAPRDREIYLVNNATSKFYGNAVVGPKDLGRLFNTREPQVLDGTILTPPFGYADSRETSMIDFAVVISPGESFTNSANYRYKWVDGAPPASDQRGGAVRDPVDDAGHATPTSPPVVPPVVPPVPPPTVDGETKPVSPPQVPEPANTTRFTVQAGVRRAKAGEIVRVPVYLLNPGGVANVNATVSYTSSVAVAEGKPLRGNVLGNSLFEANAAEAGIARVGFAGSKPVTDSGLLAHISFKAIGKPGDRTVLKVAVSTANTADGKSMTADTIHGELLIVSEGGKIPGDHDGDGEITAADALSALKMSVKLIDEDLNLDLDKDGNVTSNDARMILIKAVGK